MLNLKIIFLYKIDGKIFLRSCSQTIKGMYMEYGPYFLIEETLEPIVLGKQILRTFEECITGIPQPEDISKLSVLEKADPYSTSEEAKTLKKLKKVHKDLRLSITYNGSEYAFNPHRVVKKSASEGVDCEPLTSSPDPETLGNTLIEAFKLCK
jgi:hypothetical protein